MPLSFITVLARSSAAASVLPAQFDQDLTDGAATRRRKALAACIGAACLSLGGVSTTAWAQEAAAPAPIAAASAPVTTPAKEPLQQSIMDEPLFRMLLIAEVQANAGDADSAYQIYLEAAKRYHNSQLYQRAVEIAALRNRSGEQALTAAKAWRQAFPQSREAAEFQSQILLALGRSGELAAPLRALIQLTPSPQQPQVLANLPRTLARLADKQAAAQVVDDATQPWRQPPLELAEAWIASAEGWLLAKNGPKSFASLQRAVALKPTLPGNGLLAVDLMPLQPQAEDIVKQQLATPNPPPIVLLAYGRRLAASQRYTESATQLEAVLKAQPEQMGTWLTLAAVRLELKQLDQAEAALQPVLAQREASPMPQPDPDATKMSATASDLEQAYLLMSQVDEQRNRLTQAGEWLERADPKHEKINIQGQRARLLFRQGKLADARKLLRGLPETEPRDAVTKYQAEAQLLRDAKQPDEAYKVLSEAVNRFPEDSDLIYDQAMLAEKLHKFSEMEQLLHKVIELAPDNANAFNALGYSLADRGVRLEEARDLIKKALDLRPGDPFITDSLGWLEFKLGHAAEASRLLRAAYDSRPDPEIAAHLGEVLWSQNKPDEARQLWRDAFKIDADNDTLKDTMKRFKVSP